MPMRPGSDSDAAARVLLIDSDAASLKAMTANLSECFRTPPLLAKARSGQAATEMLRARTYDIVLIDISSIDDLSVSVDDAVARLAKLASGALLIALSSGASVSTAVAAMGAGAHDVVAKPITGPGFATRIGELARRHGKARALTIDSGSAELDGDFAGLVGVSPQMQVVYEQIDRIAPATAPVFITGENGTGKELCAMALHRRGPRAAKPLIIVDCAAIGREMMETELFGSAHGAHDARKGAFELADGGMLFLDEIGDLDLSLQGKLLRMLQTGTVSRIGENAARPVDVRIVCATNRNPLQLIAERNFREDLFYRLHVLPIHVPPLRQRPTDIAVLARHFLDRYAGEEHKRFAGFSAEAANLLVARDWPGNVRQLENLMHRLVVMFSGGEISVPMIGAADLDNSGWSRESTAMRPPNGQAVLPMWQQEQRIIEAAIESFNGNIALAAAALELSPSTIYRKRQAWGELDGKLGAA